MSKVEWKFLARRECTLKTNENFKKAHNNLNNFVPAVGELNGDRSNFQFANITGEKRAYGKCDFEVDFKSDTADPADSVKGNVARVYFHMMQVHNIKLDTATLGTMLVWDKLDPVDEFECVRNQRIIFPQGLGNQFVSNQCEN
ncbi:MAG: deoxyribonuclease-1 [Psychroserpens sp.]|jgi:deoxyribonuclease-1